MDLATIASILIGGAISGVVTWLVAWFYYKRAGDELRQEAAELRRRSELILDALEAGNIVKLSRDSLGTVVGITIRASAAITVSPVVSAQAHVTPPHSGRE